MGEHCRHNVGVVNTRTSNVEILGEFTQAQRNFLGFLEEVRELQRIARHLPLRPEQ